MEESWRGMIPAMESTSMWKRKTETETDMVITMGTTGMGERRLETDMTDMVITMGTTGMGEGRRKTGKTDMTIAMEGLVPTTAAAGGSRMKIL